jgi:heme-degrading monooxygenase HmoA
MIRSVLYLHPRHGEGNAVAEIYRSGRVLEVAAAQDGCLGAEFQLPVEGAGPILVTALWRDALAYQQWLESPAREAYNRELEALLDDSSGLKNGGELYEVVLAATSDGGTW